MGQLVDIGIEAGKYLAIGAANEVGKGVGRKLSGKIENMGNNRIAKPEVSDKANSLYQRMLGKSEIKSHEIPDSPEKYNRPYLRKNTVAEIYKNAPKNKKGLYLDANTGKPINGTPDIGHKPGHEFRREAKKAFKEGLSQEEFNKRMNNPNLYQLEDPHNNRSHKYEDKS